MKEKLQFILFGLLISIFSSIMTVCATSYQYDSSDVLYDNTGSGLESTDVQGAVSELYRTATDYSSLNNRVSTLESNYSDYRNWFNIYKGSTRESVLALRGDNDKVRGVFFFDSNTDTTYLEARGSNGTTSDGTLYLRGNSVKIKGKEAAVKPTFTAIVDRKDIPTTATSYPGNWSIYDFLIIQVVYYGNVLESIVVDTSYFSGTSPDRRPIISAYFSEKYYLFDVYKNDTSSVYIKGYQAADSRFGVRIWGAAF